MSATEPGPEGHRPCGHICPEHRYTTSEIAQLISSIRREVHPLWERLMMQNRGIDELEYQLVHIGKCIKFGSPLLEPPPQTKLYRDPITGADVWTYDPPSYEVAPQPNDTEQGEGGIR